MFLARPKPKSSTISNIACVTRLTDLGCIVTTTNLTAETSDKYSEHSSAVWNVYSSAWGWPALEREQILALSVRLLLCNQKMLSCNERKGSGTPSVSHFHTANASQHSCINSCNTPAQQLLFTSLSRLLHYLSLQLSVLLIYPSAQDQLFSICQLSFPSCTFPMYFSLALSLIAFLLHVSLHITLLLFLPLPCVTLPYLAFTLPYPCFTLPLFHLGLSNIQADLIPFQPHPTASWNPAWAMRRV